VFHFIVELARCFEISGYTEEIIYRKGVFEKGSIFISKPVSPHEILIRIREVLDK